MPRYLAFAVMLLFLAGCGQNPLPGPIETAVSTTPAAPTLTADPTINIISEPYALSDKSALITYQILPEVKKYQLLFGQDSEKLINLAANPYAGVAQLKKLIQGARYFYRIKTEEGLSAISQFTLPTANLALGKAIDGTFTELPPSDPYVNKDKDVLARVVDGSTSYFEGMATSGPVTDEDQQIIIDLGAGHPINSVITSWRALAYPKSFAIELSADGDRWEEAAADLNAEKGVGARSDTGDPLKVLRVELGGRKSRYIRISIKKRSPIYVKHLEWDFVQLMEAEIY